MGSHVTQSESVKLTLPLLQIASHEPNNWFGSESNAVANASTMYSNAHGCGRNFTSICETMREWL